jgi:hypothetical protein
MLAALLHCGNRVWRKCEQQVSGQPKELAPAVDLRFNLKKVAYMLVAAFKTDNDG